MTVDNLVRERRFFHKYYKTILANVLKHANKQQWNQRKNDHFLPAWDQRGSYGFIKVVLKKIGGRKMSNCLNALIKASWLIWNYLAKIWEKEELLWKERWLLLNLS